MSDAREHLCDDLPAFALGALDAAAAAAVSSHLTECERCRVELRLLQPAADALPLAVEQRQPPARLRRRLMKTVRTEAATSRRWQPPASPALRLRPALGLALATAVVIAGVVGYAVHGGGLEQTTVALQASTEAPGGATGDLVRFDGSATLNLHDLPAVPGDDVYQAWVRRGQTIVPSAVFIPARDGDASAGISGLENADEVMVTREPDAGSRVPSSAPIFRASLS